MLPMILQWMSYRTVSSLIHKKLTKKLDDTEQSQALLKRKAKQNVHSS